jgi:hypothetical protein
MKNCTGCGASDDRCNLAKRNGYIACCPDCHHVEEQNTSECACCHQVVGVSQSVLQDGQELCKECAK